MSTKFAKGQSGNPKGRTPGSGVTGTLRKAIAKKAPEIIETLIASALNGDTAAASLLMNKIIPNLKASSEPVTFKLDAAAGLTQTGETIVQGIAKGDVPLDSATQILTSLASLAKLQEIDEITKRIEALEQKQWMSEID